MLTPDQEAGPKLANESDVTSESVLPASKSVEPIPVYSDIFAGISEDFTATITDMMGIEVSEEPEDEISGVGKGIQIPSKDIGNDELIIESRTLVTTSFVTKNLEEFIYCKWCNSFDHNTHSCNMFHHEIQSDIDNDRLRFSEAR